MFPAEGWGFRGRRDGRQVLGGLAVQLTHVRRLGATMVFLAVSTTVHSAESMLVNGGFEDVQPIASLGAEGGAYGGWQVLGGAGLPRSWQLNGYFTGDFGLVEGDAFEGARFVRITATMDGRSGDMVTPVARDAWTPGNAYVLSLHYRRGPLLVKAYEYRTPGKSPAVVTLARSLPSHDETTWQRFESLVVAPSCDMLLVLAAAEGTTVEMDDVQLQRKPGFVVGQGWANVRDFGASGSDYETAAKVTAGSRCIEVENVGDFKPGQGVTVTKCYPHYTGKQIRGPDSMYRFAAVNFDDVAEVRGFDGSGGDWLVFLLDITAADPLRYRWTDDLARTWKGQDVPAGPEWQALSGGLEVRFKGEGLEPGHVVTFSARTQLRTVIERIEGTSVWLRDTPTRSVDDAVVRHLDTDALRFAMKSAIGGGLNLYVPNGTYRIDGSLAVRNADLTIQGQNAARTVIDISSGVGSVFQLYGGRNITIRNFTMIGHTSLADKPGTMHNAKGQPFWCCALKPCNAVTFTQPENVLIENVHARRMASEAFYCQGASRVAGEEPPAAYTKWLTFYRCSVTDCAANAFNNNDTSEGTAVLHCRIDGAGWHAYEGPGRFIRLIGNYIRNAGPFTVGDMSHRPAHLNELGCGQAMIRDNVFESGGRCGGIVVNHGAGQVTIANNVFVNYNGTAITVSGQTTRNSYPAKNMVVSGNIIDLTYHGEKPGRRSGIRVDASNVVVADNQIYVRGKRLAHTTGIDLIEGVTDVTVHDNLIRNCAVGLAATRRGSSVTEVFEDGSFTEASLPLEWQVSHRYRGWHIAWRSDRTIGAIDHFDPETCRFHLLGSERPVQAGDAFELFPPQARWTIHDNTVSGCAQGMSLNVYGSATTTLRNNLIDRGDAADASCGMRLAGRVNVTGNHIIGFGSDSASGLELLPDRLGRTLPNIVRTNVVESCVRPVVEMGAGLWDACIKSENLFIGSDGVALPDAQVLTSQTLPDGALSRTCVAGKLKGAVAVDGDLGEWEDVPAAVVAMAPDGTSLAPPHDSFHVACDDEAVLFGFRVDFGRPRPPDSGDGVKWGASDGIELAFRHADPAQPTPIFMLWLRPDGTFSSGRYGGATPEHVAALERLARCAARSAPAGWTCEVRIPFDAMGLSREQVSTLKLNVTIHHVAEGTWLTWAPTGSACWHVDAAGTVKLR